MLRINSRLSISLIDIELSAMRAQGAGGQNVNKVSSAIHLRFNILACSALSEDDRARLLALDDKRISADGVFILKAQRHRTQLQNREDALLRLQAWLTEALQPQKIRRATAPTKASRQRRLDSKSQRSSIKAGRRSVSVE